MDESGTDYVALSQALSGGAAPASAPALVQHGGASKLNFPGFKALFTSPGIVTGRRNGHLVRIFLQSTGETQLARALLRDGRVPNGWDRSRS